MLRSLVESMLRLWQLKFFNLYQSTETRISLGSEYVLIENNLIAEQFKSFIESFIKISAYEFCKTFRRIKNFWFIKTS